MAKSSTPYFYQSFTSIRAATAAPDTFQDLAVGGADDSDVVSLVVTNTGSSVRTLTIAFNQGSADDVILVMNIPANAGTALNVNAISLINTGVLPGTYLNKHNNLVFTLRANEKLRFKQNAGTDLIIVGRQLNY